MTVPAIIIMCWLGFWQIERLEWKLEKIANLQERFSLAPVSLPSAPMDVQAWEYRHVQLSGVFMHDAEMLFYGAGPNGRPGYELFTPLKTEEGPVVIINRGWIPEALKDPSARADIMPSVIQELQGVLRLSQQRQRFGPDNDTKANLWFYPDIKMMAEAASLENVYAMLVYADGDQAQAKYPVSGRTQTILVNNHLAYAFTWFAFAFILLVIYVIFHLRSAKTSEIDKD